MFCEKCGRPTEGEQTICSSCAAEQLAQTPEAVETLEFDNDTFELNTAGVAPEKKMPKKKGGLIAAIAAIAVVAAVAVGAFLNWDSISAFFGRNFKEPEEYLVDVESAAIADYSAELSGAYGKFVNSYSANQTAAEAEIHLTLGDDLLSLIESALSQQGVTMDLTWLKDIKLSLGANVQDTAMQMNLGIGLGMKDLLNADVIVDAESGKSYIAIPTLNDDYVYIDIPSNIPLDQVTDMLSQSKQMTEELIKALPTEKELDELIMEARTSTDQEFRKAMYKACLDIIIDWACEIPVYQRQNAIIFSTERVNMDTMTPDITTFYNWYAEIQNIEMN